MQRLLSGQMRRPQVPASMGRSTPRHNSLRLMSARVRRISSRLAMRRRSLRSQARCSGRSSSMRGMVVLREKGNGPAGPGGAGRRPSALPSHGGLPRPAWRGARKQEAWRKGAKPGVALPACAVRVCRYARSCSIVVRPLPSPGVVRFRADSGRRGGALPGGWSGKGRSRTAGGVGRLRPMRTSGCRRLRLGGTTCRRPPGGVRGRTAGPASAPGRCRRRSWSTTGSGGTQHPARRGMGRWHRSSRRYVESNLDPKIEERVAACAYEFGTERDRVKPVLWVVLRDELMQRVEQTRSWCPVSMVREIRMLAGVQPVDTAAQWAKAISTSSRGERLAPWRSHSSS